MLKPQLSVCLFVFFRPSKFDSAVEIDNQGRVPAGGDTHQGYRRGGGQEEHGNDQGDAAGVWAHGGGAQGRVGAGRPVQLFPWRTNRLGLKRGDFLYTKGQTQKGVSPIGKSEKADWKAS